MVRPTEQRKANLVKSTAVFIVGNIEETMRWYEDLGFEADYFPPGFAILCRGEVQIFFQQQDGYSRPDDPGARERGALQEHFGTPERWAAQTCDLRGPSLW